MSKADPIFGIDVSHYQEGLNIPLVAERGYEFVVAKATEGPYRDGSKYTDPSYGDFVRKARNAGMVPGAYHFLVETPARYQVDHFLRVVGDTEGLILMVDFETYNPPYGYLTPSNETLKQFVELLKERIGEHPIIIYSSRGFWEGGMPSGSIGKYGTSLAWDAYYRTMSVAGRPKEYYEKVSKYGWDTPWGKVEPLFWQFTPAGTVAGMNLDVDAFRGTREDLLDLTKGGIAPRVEEVAKVSKVDRAIEYGKRLLQPNTPYGWWRGSWPPPSHPPYPEWMFFPFGLPDPETEVPTSNCAGLINLMAHAAGVSYRNGTLGYAKDLVNKRPYKAGIRVKRGEVLVNDNVSGPGAADLSHIVMYIGDGRVISCDHHLGGAQPGVNIHPLEGSHEMFHYEWVGEVPGLGTDD